MQKQKNETIKSMAEEVCMLIPLDHDKAKYAFKGLRKAELKELRDRLRQKEVQIAPYDRKTMVMLEEKHNLCNYCDHQKKTPYGMEYCALRRKIKSIDNVHGVTFEHIAGEDDPLLSHQEIYVLISCNHLLPKLKERKEAKTLADFLEDR